jgi:hypothetical protein
VPLCGLPACEGMVGNGTAQVAPSPRAEVQPPAADVDQDVGLPPEAIHSLDDQGTMIGGGSAASFPDRLRQILEPPAAVEVNQEVRENRPAAAGGEKPEPGDPGPTHEPD